MIDINLIRENPDLVKENIKKKFQDDKLPLVDKVKKLDEQWRKLKFEEEQLRKSRNDISKKIAEAKKSKNEKEAKSLMTKAKKIPEEISESEQKRKKLEDKIKEIMYKIPNIIHKSVPIGKDDKENVEVKKFGKPQKFNFPVKSHVELGEDLGVLDFDTSAKTSGTGFYFMKGDLALLNMALINFSRDFMVKQKFEYVEPPLMIKKEVLSGVYSNTEIDAMSYKIENEDLYLIGTSEQILAAFHAGETLQEKDLPKKFVAFSPCFRREAGSYGKDVKGLYRVHEFWKVEQVIIAGSDIEESKKLHDELQKNTEEIIEDLKIPYRRLLMCTGDMGEPQIFKYDTEIWMPYRKGYGEIASNSIMGDFQTRRLKIKYRKKDGSTDYCFSLNDTAIPSPRILIAILENYQQKDGSIKVPEVLQQLVGFKEIKA